MADFEKVYDIKFNVGTALANLKDLDKVLSKIEKNKLATHIGQASLKLKNLRTESKKTGRALDQAFAKNRAKRKIDDIKKSADKAGTSIRRMGDNGQTLKNLSRNLTRYVVLPLAAIGAASIKTAIDINKSMASVATLLDNPTEKIYVLKKAVQDMAIETGKSTGDLSEGLYQVVSALGESSENLDQLKLASDAAVAGVSSTKDAINLLSAAGKGYNDVSAEALKHTSDLAFQTVKLGVTTFPELAASMGRVIPLAAQFGTSQEELFATMATLTGVTGNTAEVTTQLSSVYSAFMKPSGAMNDALKDINKSNDKYNFQTAGAMLKTLGFRKSIDLMNESAGGNEEALGKIFKRKEAILGVLPLISSQSENYTKKLAAMEVASGSTAAALKEQTEGINAQGHSWEKTKQRMVVFSENLGDRLLPILGRILDMAEPIMKWLENMDEGSIDAAISVSGLVIELALGLKLLSGISSIAGSVASGIGGIGTAAAGAKPQMMGLLGVVSALLVAYEALKFAQAGAEAAEKAKLDEQNAGTSNARNLAKADLTRYSDDTLSKLSNLKSGTLANAKDEAESFHFTDAGDTEAQASYESEKQQLSSISAEIKRRESLKSDGFLADKMPTGGQRGGGGSTTDPWGGSGDVVNQAASNVTVNTGGIVVNAKNADANEVVRIIEKKQSKEVKRALGNYATDGN